MQMTGHGQMASNFWRSCALLLATLTILAGCASLRAASGPPITGTAERINGEYPPVPLDSPVLPPTR